MFDATRSFSIKEQRHNSKTEQSKIEFKNKVFNFQIKCKLSSSILFFI